MNRRAAALAFCVLATTWATWPWGVKPGGGFVQRDALFSQVGIEHLVNALLHGAAWRDVPLGWPLPDGVTQVDWMLGEALLSVPGRLLDADPSRVYTLVVVVGLFATTVACQRLAEALTGPGPHTWIAAAVGGLGPVQMGHAQHVNLVHHEGAVLAGLLTGAGLVTRRPILAAIGGLCVGASVHFGVYMGLHAGVVLAAVATGAAIARVGDRRSWLALVAGLGGGLATALPVAAVYLGAEATRGIAISGGELAHDAWDLARTLAPIPGALAHRLLPPGVGTPDTPNPGYVALALAIVGATRAGSPRWAWRVVGAVVVATALLALGPVIQLGGRPIVPGPMSLLLRLPAADALRGPARWLALTHVGVGLFAARALADRPRLALVASIAALAEVGGARAEPFSAVAPPPIYALLDDAPEGPLHDQLRNGCRCGGEVRLRAALFHGRPLVGGHYARDFAAMKEIDTLAGAWPRPEGLAFLEASGVRLVLDHPPLPPAPAGARCTTVEDHRLCVLDDVPTAGDVEALRTLAPAVARALDEGLPPLPPRPRRVGPITSRTGQARRLPAGVNAGSVRRQEQQ